LLRGNCRVLQGHDAPAYSCFFNHRCDDADAMWQLQTLPIDSAAQFDYCVDDRQVGLPEPNCDFFLSKAAALEGCGMTLGQRPLD